MKRITTTFFLAGIFSLFGTAQERFQWAPPLLKFNSVFFKDEIKLSMVFAQSGTEIRYTTNGMEPTEKDAVYRSPVSITKNFTTVKAKVFGTGFLPSETAQAVFVKDGLPLASVTYPEPAPRYVGEGPHTLMNNRGGMAGFTNNTWLGFLKDTVDIIITLKKKQTITSVLFNLLQNYDAWIFFPEKADVFYADKKGDYIRSGVLEFTPDENKDRNACRSFLFRLNHKVNTTSIKLQLHLLKKMPDWHPGKGQKSWIFIDEVKLY